MPTRTQLFVGIGAIGTLLIGGLAVWLITSRPSATSDKNITAVGFGVDATKSIGVGSTQKTNGEQIINTTQTSKQVVFKITDGPVTSATFVQTPYPTSTIVRYITQDDGHVLDFPLDTPGVIARVKSNTTIPGTTRAVWGVLGSTAYMQYLDSGVIKTVSLIFPYATSSRSVTRPVQIQFLPDNILGIDTSPDGAQIAYLLAGGAGAVDGYVAKSDGTGSKKLFSLPLREVILSWPAAEKLLLQTKSASGVPGLVLSVDVKTGGVIPLIYARGITATADQTFSHIVYKTSLGGAVSDASYAHDVKKGLDVALSFDPTPEKCVWSMLATSTMYCAGSLQYTPPGYLDLWHKGLSSMPDSIVSFNIDKNYESNTLAVPGSADGGVASDVAYLAVSPDDRFLLFIKKGDRSLWVVRLEKGR